MLELLLSAKEEASLSSPSSLSPLSALAQQGGQAGRQAAPVDLASSAASAFASVFGGGGTQPQARWLVVKGNALHICNGASRSDLFPERSVKLADIEQIVCGTDAPWPPAAGGGETPLPLRLLIRAKRWTAPLRFVGGDVSELVLFALGLQSLMSSCLNQPYLSLSKALWARARSALTESAAAHSTTPALLLRRALEQAGSRRAGGNSTRAGMRRPHSATPTSAPTSPTIGPVDLAAARAAARASAAMAAAASGGAPRPLSAYVGDSGAEADSDDERSPADDFDEKVEAGTPTADAPHPPPRRKPPFASNLR
ncbi:hypothetical protein T492DRAFT_471189 [Pavlovales sp. CCMP2436]|nr:hypothetical protein T492DRAFT_471189 [Pavlovales sp. CCMP2436]